MTDDVVAYASSQHRSSHPHITPAKAQTFGMYLFLLGLAIVFGSGMLIYVFIRVRGAELPELGALRDQMTNWKLYLSTFLVLAASVTIHIAHGAVRREKQKKFMRWLIITDVLAVLFLLVQAPAMWELLRLDTGIASVPEAALRPDRLYTILFVFILIHALHVLGGMVYLAMVTLNGAAGKYDHEHSVGVRHAALYWHFLDLVWIMMLGTFILLG